MMLHEQLGVWECGLLMSWEWDNIRTAHWTASLFIIPIIQIQPHPAHYHLIVSSYNDFSTNFFNHFDTGREGASYSSLMKENKKEKTPVPSKPKGKAHAPPRKPRGQPHGDWFSAGEEGDGFD